MATSVKRSYRTTLAWLVLLLTVLCSLPEVAVAGNRECGEFCYRLDGSAPHGAAGEIEIMKLKKKCRCTANYMPDRCIDARVKIQISSTGVLNVNEVTGSGLLTPSVLEQILACAGLQVSVFKEKWLNAWDKLSEEQKKKLYKAFNFDPSKAKAAGKAVKKFKGFGGIGVVITLSQIAYGGLPTTDEEWLELAVDITGTVIPVVGTLQVTAEVIDVSSAAFCHHMDSFIEKHNENIARGHSVIELELRSFLEANPYSVHAKEGFDTKYDSSVITPCLSEFYNSGIASFSTGGYNLTHPDPVVRARERLRFSRAYQAFLRGDGVTTGLHACLEKGVIRTPNGTPTPTATPTLTPTATITPTASPTPEYHGCRCPYEGDSGVTITTNNCSVADKNACMSSTCTVLKGHVPPAEEIPCQVLEGDNCEQESQSTAVTSTSSQLLTASSSSRPCCPGLQRCSPSSPCQRTCQAEGCSNPSRWQNRVLPCDVNADGRVSAIDAGNIVHWLNSGKPTDLRQTSLATDKPPPFVDVNGDCKVSNEDINAIGNCTSGCVPEGSMQAGACCTPLTRCNNGACQVTCQPPPNPPGTFQLLVSKRGAGSGRVSSNPSGIDCGSQCSSNFASNSRVTLMASVTGSSTFLGWEGDCSGRGPCEIAMDRPRSVSATFGTVCSPSCAGKQCGDDGCGGSCGMCGSGFICNPSRKCVATCVPNCTTKACGDDGCGGSCGSCSSGLVCNSANQCVPGCTPNCQGKSCGTDGCGGVCGICPPGQNCDAQNKCSSICTPNCLGRICGGDGCGGSCGSCRRGLSCRDGRCR